MAVSLDSFAKELKKFFKDVHHFLTETVEGYSMNAEDDQERDMLVDCLEKLEAMTGKLKGLSDSASTVSDETQDIYDDTENNNNQSKKAVKVEQDEYLAPSDIRKNENKSEGIMEEVYEDPNSTDPPQDIYDDTENANDESNDAIDEDMYEDPYAERRLNREEPTADTEDELDDDSNQSIEDGNKANKKQNKAGKKGKINKKEKKPKKERLASDNKSEGSMEELAFKEVAVSELTDADMQGFLKKHKEKNSLWKHNRWCVFKDKVLYYFENQKSKKQKGQISLEEYTASACKDEVEKKRYIFQLTADGKKTYYFTSQREKDMKEWVHFLNTGSIYESRSKGEGAVCKPPSEDGDQDVYEDTETIDDSQGAVQNAEEDEGIMDDLYEDPSEYSRDLKETAKPIEESTTPQKAPPPVLPSRQDDKPSPVPNGAKKPPVLPSRDPKTSLSDRKPAVLPQPPSETANEDDGEIYDDTEADPPPLPPPPKTEPPAPVLPPRVIPDVDSPLLRNKSVTVNPTPTSVESLPPPPAEATNFSALYYGVWACHNVSPDELDFERGCIIEIVNKDKYDQCGWWVGKLGPKVGIVPKSYLIPAYEEI